MVTVRLGPFEWDDHKDKTNEEKHGIVFSEARKAFADPRRIIAIDELHSKEEQRFY